MTIPEIKIKILQTLSEIDHASWEALRNPSFPFTAWPFLNALEQAHCLGPRTGWTPLYLIAYRDAELVGALILFAKDNSYGEYIFDFGWAQAYENAGLPYYPKLVAAIPFTPATGSKILIKSSLDADFKNRITIGLLQKSKDLFRELETSSLHFLFVPEKDLSLYLENGFFIRHSFQYHWKNDNYSSFEDFLKKFRSKRRREIHRERSQVSSQQITLQRLTGEDLKVSHAELMYQFYQNTIDKREGFEYLTPDFFTQIFATMKENILLVVASKDGKEVAAALNFFSPTALYGRYWGSLDEYRALHFEVCYYQGIEFCIAKGLSLFEAGAQGEHKFQRGFLPALTFSAHRIAHPGLQQAIQDFTRREEIQIGNLFRQYAEQTPFSREN